MTSPVCDPALSRPRPDTAPPAPAEALIQLDDVHLNLASAAGKVNVLNGITLRIGAGETVGVTGASGSGKTSLLMVIAGLERATSGRVQVAGERLDRLDEDSLSLFRRRHLGIVFQAFHLVPTMTAIENVAMPLELAGARDAFVRAEAELAAVGLGHRLLHYPSQLSGGEQQRVAIARAFASEPSLVLADEPTGNLDAATGAAVIDLLFSHRERSGTTLLLVTHDRDLVARCGRNLRIVDGRIVDGAPPPA
ncbi:MAG: ATP-binding cassette domain-containing protein [Alphaproteobacteria bacterium]